MQVTGGATNVTTYFALRKTSDGTAATGLTITDFDLQYVRSGAAPSAKVDATALAATDSAHADNKAIEIDATDQPGLYRVDWPDAAFAAGVSEVILTVKVATAFTEHLAVQIDPPVNVTRISDDSAAADNLESACDNYSATRGLTGTALPAAAADAAGGVSVSDAGGLDLDALNTAAVRLTAARAQVLDDWINAGRLDAILDLILADTNELQTDDVPGTLSTIEGKVDTVDGNVDAILVDTAEIGAAGAGLSDLGGMSAGMKAEVNAEVVDVLKTDTVTLPGQTAPPLAPTMEQILGWLYKLARNRKKQDATSWKLYADDESTVDAKATVSDDGTDAIKQEIVSGP